MNCDYCGKEIDSKETYGRLGSGLLTHDKCYSLAFTEKGWSARKFRFKNSFLYKLFELKFFISYIYYQFKTRKRR